MLRKSSFLVVLTLLISLASSPAQACDKAAAKKALAKMRPHIVSRVSEEDGWVVVIFGQDYFYWTDGQKEGIVTTYADADACVTGQARSLEFRSPSGKLVARADRVRGIQMK
jgi:hypothetical protein